MTRFGQCCHRNQDDKNSKWRCAVSNIRLQSDHDTLVIAEDFWEEILEWAEDNGWLPEQPPDLYRGDTGLTVTAGDAGNLADALEFIAGGLVFHKTVEAGISDDFLRKLIDGLQTLSTFFQSGSFRIC